MYKMHIKGFERNVLVLKRISKDSKLSVGKTNMKLMEKIAEEHGRNIKEE